MPKFLVTVTRTCVATTQIEVVAENADDAWEKAMDQAEGSVDFSGLEQNAEYEATRVEQVN